MGTKNPHRDPATWRTALDLLVTGQNRAEVERKSGLPKNGIVQRLNGTVNTTTDDLIAVARATGQDVAAMLDDLGVISIKQIEATPEFRAVYQGVRGGGDTPRQKYIDHVESQRFRDRAVLDQALAAWAATFGKRSDWQVEGRSSTAWRSVT